MTTTTKAAHTPTEPKYQPDQQVEILDRGTWRPAVIVSKPAYYYRGKCWGYEMRFLSGTEIQAGGITPSQGGWASENSIREAAIQKAKRAL